MNKLCCAINGTSSCATCAKPLCEKHTLGRGSHYGYNHKVQRCLQCHRKFVQFHRTGKAGVSFKAWLSQISRRRKKQGKVAMPRPQREWFSF
jgi:hypothetical protein